ncbi:MAG: RNA-directed DNA polymerase [Anaerolineae bacterium]|nr:RNA-directed DNA polymerase [Candidatus Roseilinea sp.]MDW8450245.1 RNA-directed DNA polymerase [Anaerolineae bacterium]
MSVQPERELFPRVCDWDNLWLAYERASRGKRGGAPAATFEYMLADNLLQLQEELREKTYQPGRYHSFYIHEPKRRLISAAPFRDRVVHHALCNVTAPLMEAQFIPDSYANRVGKGTHRALDRCQQFARRYPYVLQCDVKQFFPSIDHAILRETLRATLHSTDVLWLIDRILESGRGVLSEEYEMVYFPGDDLFAINRPRGLPIGNLTSQWWGNCYLNPFDQFVKRELGCRGYVRYVDDFLLFSDDKAMLWTWRDAIIERLAHYRLTIHAGAAYPRPVAEGIPFLGFIVFPDHRRLKRRRGLVYRRRLRRLAQSAPQALIDASVRGWINHARYGDTYGLRRAVLAECGLLGLEVQGLWIRRIRKRKPRQGRPRKTLAQR